MNKLSEKKHYVEQELGFPIEELGLISIGKPRSHHDLEIYHRKKKMGFIIEDDEVFEKLVLAMLDLEVPRVERKMTKLGRLFFRTLDRITFRERFGDHWKPRKK